MADCASLERMCGGNSTEGLCSVAERQTQGLGRSPERSEPIPTALKPQYGDALLLT